MFAKTQLVEDFRYSYQSPPSLSTYGEDPSVATGAQFDMARPGKSLGPLQIVHPPPPNEQEWVLTSGNESLVDNVLSISLKFGGRLVSMGYFVRQRHVVYYAIMHKYTGPVFIKPSPMTYDELKIAVKYVGVWQTRRSDPVHYEAHYGLTLDSCMLRNKLLTAKGYIATLFSVFSNKNQVLCTGIWEQQEGRKSYIVVGEDLKQMYREIPVRFLQGSPELLSEPQMDFLIQRVEHFMRDLNIPGLSIAISKREQLKFAAGNKFAKRNFYKKHVTDVTVRHLLEHTAGLFTSDVLFCMMTSCSYLFSIHTGGWDNLQSDAAWIQPQLNTEELITYVLDTVPLEYKPGTKWIYSNFGYQLLGYLAEHLSGMDYESFVKKSIFAPAGVHDIQVAGPTISDRAP
ncbi:hypothetical protein TELCIR_06931 [Teladorsagia circumcincta]|uniref:Beta-lactamase-related domain-containing protein n=1 Tax=Teladorsagia circumcincta TaxID=45464 RepID=A0A2G9UNZ0_TELCI|nr:hypothetical protein TELCIR_06931 [Teladorsagia circumcincta]